MNKQTLKLSVEIDAPKEMVWEVLFKDATYREWTAAFHPGSYAETDDWKEGTRVYFKIPSGDGMFSKIKIHKPAEIISFEHLGMLKKGEEVPDDPEFEKWSGMTETYRIRSDGGKSQLLIEQELDSEYIAMFKPMWEKALEKVKQLSENA